MTVTTLQVALRPRAYVAVTGPDAASYLERMVSNEVESLEVGGAREALLLTPKARVVATMTVWRRGADDFLLLSEPHAGERLARELLRSRFAAKCEIAPEEHRSVVVLGADELVLNQHKGALPNHDYGVPAVELHTGRYANSWRRNGAALTALGRAAEHARRLGLAVHAGHGLTYENVGPVAGIPEIEELNIGHSIVSNAVFWGMEEAVRRMKHLVQDATTLRRTT